MKIAPSRPHQLIKDLRAFAIQDIGQRRDDLMLSRCLAVRNVAKCLPEPLKAHFADHWFGYRPGCTRNLNIEGVNRKQHGTCRHLHRHAGIKSIRIALGDDVRHRLKAHCGRARRNTQIPPPWMDTNGRNTTSVTRQLCPSRPLRGRASSSPRPAKPRTRHQRCSRTRRLLTRTVLNHPQNR